jgi:hypothetical protein
LRRPLRAASGSFALTASRSGAARLMRFDQIDFEASIWRCPPEQMKDSRNRADVFIVPLGDAALEAIGKPGRSPFVFASDDGEPINDMTLITLTRALRREHDDWRDPDIGRPFVVHGLRSSFRGWAQFHRFDREVAELVRAPQASRPMGPPLRRPDRRDPSVQARMTLSPQARRYARRLARDSFRVKPNEAEIAAMRAIIGDDQSFARLSPAAQRIVFVGIMKGRAMCAFTDNYNEIRNVTRRKREPVTLQHALDLLLKILDLELARCVGHGGASRDLF